MKIAETPPVHCSSCWAQQTGKVHVDFESSYDGPVFNEEVATGDGGSVRNLSVAIDELIICEDCLAGAAALLGFERPDDQADKVAELEGQLDNLRERMLERDEYAQSLEAALAKRPGANANRVPA